MQTGTYVAERLLVECVALAAAAKGISCVTMSEGWVLRLERDGKIRWVVGAQFDVNASGAGALAQDKVGTHLALQCVGIASVPHVLVKHGSCEPLSTVQLQAMFGAPFIIKPLDGAGGHGVQKVANAVEAMVYVHQDERTAWAASPYLNIAVEYRVIVLDGKVLLAYQKTEPVEVDGIRFFNLRLGAVAQDIADEQRLAQVTQIAQKACQEMSLRLAAVDLVLLESGELMVIEVNSSITMEHYAAQSSEYKNRAARVYDAVVAAMFA